MKKLILLGLCISNLTFANYNLENCKGYEEEKLSVSSFMTTFEDKLGNFLEYLTTESIENCKENLRKGENLVDHMMYYHHNDLDVTSEFVIKRLKQLLLNIDFELDKVRKEVENEQK